MMQFRFASPDLKPWLAVLYAAASLLLQPGCAMLNSESSLSSFDFGRKKEPEYQTPRQMVPLWSDAVLHQAGIGATRGFGGRLMFYGADKHKPLQVDGTLIVYAWNDDKGNMERAPDRKYVFTKEDFQKHYSVSRLGHSYSFWLPCDAAGGPLQKMSLIARFISTDGTEITSTPSHVVLPGPGQSSPFYEEVVRSRQKPGRRSGDSEILQTSYEESADQDFDDSRLSNHLKGKKYPGRQATEIGVTQGFLSRNMQGSKTAGTDSGVNSAASLKSSAVIEADDLLDQSDGHSPLSLDDETEWEQPGSSIDEESPVDEVEDSGRPSTRFGSFESRVRASRVGRTSRDPVRKEPLRANWLTELPDTPRW